MRVQTDSPLRVLVVDDDRDNADTLIRLVRFWGHSAAVAYSGVAALELAGTFQPNAVLLDLAMPGLSGFDVARRLRERPELDATALIAVTGYGDEEMRQRAWRRGFEWFLRKPADPAALQSLLAEVAAQVVVRTIPAAKRTKKLAVVRSQTQNGSVERKSGA
ncbi:MAG: response regulator [Gemmataceae bacterium]|nr:response regulator [Gemmataceae bacterium]